MRKATLFVLAIAVSAVALSAQDELAQYQTWMKAGAGANSALRKAVTDKSTADIAANSAKMADAFTAMAKFWADKHKDDAAKFATTIADAAKAVGGGDETALAKIGPACQGCHAIVRDGNKFKQ